MAVQELHLQIKYLALFSKLLHVFFVWERCLMFSWRGKKLIDKLFRRFIITFNMTIACLSSHFLCTCDETFACLQHSNKLIINEQRQRWVWNILIAGESSNPIFKIKNYLPDSSALEQNLPPNHLLVLVWSTSKNHFNTWSIFLTRFSSEIVFFKAWSKLITFISYISYISK